MIQDIENLDADSLVAKQMEELEREKKELASRLRAVEKRVSKHNPCMTFCACLPCQLCSLAILVC